MIEKFLEKRGRDLETFEYCYGIDTNTNSLEEWEKAKFRILIPFLSPGPTRSVSSTFSVMHNIIKSEFGSDVFVDNCYLPTKADIKVYKSEATPYLFGNVSHRLWNDYDLVSLSVSILPELYNVPFTHWFNNIPLGYNERMSVEDIPLIIAGGVCSPMADIAYGDVGNGDSCLLDGVYVGHAESSYTKVIKILMDSVGDRKRDRLKRLTNETPNFYVPGEYGFEYHSDPLHGFVIDEIKVPEGFPTEIEFGHIPDSMDTPGFERKILNVSGEGVTAGDLDISSGCSGCGSCTFCYEGTVAGRWKDRPFELLKERMKIIRLNSAPNTISWYSYNAPYYAKFVDLLHYASSRFSNMSLINLRMDCIAADPEVMTIAKALGLRRISAAIEGIGSRLRFGFLNKGVEFDQIKKFYEVVFQNRLAETKAGLIFTGYETQEDYDESLAEFKEILDMRDKMGANTSLRVTITPLVYYPHTPLQRKSKSTSILNLKQARPLRYYLQGLKALGIRSKINGRSRSTFMEQFLLTFGRIGTKHLCKISRDEPPYYGSVSKHKENELLASLEADGIDPLNYLNDIPLDHILWHEPIKCVNPNMLRKMDENLSLPLDQIKPVRFCTVSPANPPISTKGIKDGRKATCHNCGSCKTPEQKKQTLNRDIKSIHTREDFIQSLSEAQARFMSYVTLRVQPEYYFYSNKTASHYATAQILKSNPDGLEPHFFQVSKTNLNWVTSNNQRDFISGNVTFAIMWRENPGTQVISKEDIDKINDRLKTFKIVSVQNTTIVSRPLTLKDKNIYLLRSSMFGVDSIVSGYNGFDGTIQVAAKAMKELELEDGFIDHDPPTFALNGVGGTNVLTVLPLKFNPLLYISPFVNISYKNLQKSVYVESVFTLRDSDYMCSLCSEPAFEIVGKESKNKLCINCMAKMLLKRL